MPASALPCLTYTYAQIQVVLPVSRTPLLQIPVTPPHGAYNLSVSAKPEP